MNVQSFDRSEIKTARVQKNEFLKKAAECRPDLYKYSRKLTNNPWDAEDLVQETLMVAYTRLADKHLGIENLKSYLFKMATNQWITWCRRKKLQMESDLIAEEPIYHDDFYVVRDSLGTLLNYLPPKERVAFVLSEVFESKNEEIAEIMGSTEGAVKSALNRAREKVKSINATSAKLPEKIKSAEQEKIIHVAVEAFNRRDLKSFAKLFATNAVGNAPGCFFETSAEEIKKGSLFYTINTFEGQPQPSSMSAKLININGEAMFAIYNQDTLDDVWKFTVDDGEILRFDCYYCCPDVLAEVADILNTKPNNHGYWFEQLN